MSKLLPAWTKWHDFNDDSEGARDSLQAQMALDRVADGLFHSAKSDGPGLTSLTDHLGYLAFHAWAREVAGGSDTAAYRRLEWLFAWINKPLVGKDDGRWAVYGITRIRRITRPDFPGWQTRPQKLVVLDSAARYHRLWESLGSPAELVGRWPGATASELRQLGRWSQGAIGFANLKSIERKLRLRNLRPVAKLAGRIAREPVSMAQIGRGLVQIPLGELLAVVAKGQSPVPDDWDDWWLQQQPGKDPLDERFRRAAVCRCLVRIANATFINWGRKEVDPRLPRMDVPRIDARHLGDGTMDVLYDIDRSVRDSNGAFSLVAVANVVRAGKSPLDLALITAERVGKGFVQGNRLTERGVEFIRGFRGAAAGSLRLRQGWASDWMSRMRSAKANRRMDPRPFEAADAIEQLGNAVRRIGGARWAIAVTHTCDGEFLNRYLDAAEIEGDVLVLTERLEKPAEGTRLRARVVTQAGTHAKLTLVRGPRGVAFQVGSANLTSFGLGGGYRDLVLTSTLDEGHGAFIRDAVRWLRGRIGSKNLGLPLPGYLRWDKSLAELEEALERTPAGSYEFVHNDVSPLADSLSSKTNARQAAIVISPYIDFDVAQSLRKGQRPFAVVVSSSVEQRRLSGSASLRDLTAINELRASFSEPFTHAKAYMFAGPNSGVLAFGSANCTRGGLKRVAGERIGGRRSLSEILVVAELAQREAAAIYGELSRAIQPSADVPTDSDEDVSDDAEVPRLQAWAFQDGTIEIASGSPVDAQRAELLGRRSKKWFAVQPDESDSVGVVRGRPNSPRWLQACERAESGWRVRLAGEVADVIFMAAAESREPDLSELWQAPGEKGFGATAPAPTGVGMADDLPQRTHRCLDLFERRAASLCRRLELELQGPLPERLDQFVKVWESERTLGVPMPPTLVAGARLFLATRLLAVLEHARRRPGRSELSLTQRLRATLRADRASLVRECKRLDKSHWSAALRGWMQPSSWPSSGRNA